MKCKYHKFSWKGAAFSSLTVVATLSVEVLCISSF